jgi:hypothetical protein
MKTARSVTVATSHSDAQRGRSANPMFIWGFATGVPDFPCDGGVIKLQCVFSKMMRETKIIIENTLVVSETKIKPKEIENNLREQNGII